MKDNPLPQFLRPTKDMKKAIDRNAKKDEDLSYFIKQLDKEKKMAIEQLSRKQDAFRKEMVHRQDTLPSNEIKDQVFEQGNVAGTDRPRPGTNRPRRRRLRRAFSVDDISRPSAVPHLPSVTNKRHRYPASPLPHNNVEELSHFKTGSDLILPRRKNATISCNFNTIYQQLQETDKSTKDDRRERYPAPTHKTVANTSCTKSAQNAVRRHSTVAAPTSLCTPRPLQRRVTVHNLMASVDQTCVAEVESVMRLTFIWKVVLSSRSFVLHRRQETVYRICRIGIW